MTVNYSFRFCKIAIAEPRAIKTELGLVFCKKENDGPYKAVKLQSIK
jgi:hypothetical protein